jgi:hypothetical protein
MEKRNDKVKSLTGYLSHYAVNVADYLNVKRNANKLNIGNAYLRYPERAA